MTEKGVMSYLGIDLNSNRLTVQKLSLGENGSSPERLTHCSGTGGGSLEKYQEVTLTPSHVGW